MPIIAQFLGIIISMYYDEHNPPHFHASYGEFSAEFDLTGELLKGNMPKRQLRFIQAWAELHSSELLDNWDGARNSKPFTSIRGLS